MMGSKQSTTTEEEEMTTRKRRRFVKVNPSVSETAVISEDGQRQKENHQKQIIIIARSPLTRRSG